eukprot:TRINITY_DN3142_c0_g1_i1.p1 TRINITY_DN3142_c0_g1~~TRINITY_DN3142_c0_g1_i1.p1  ORF type:complete len:310 (-),score=60.97 TRINITY_DN3142_c0_g1_i1:94-1023(-)
MLSGVWKSSEGRSEEDEDEERTVRGKRKANEDAEEAENRRKRGSYKCSKCGQPKKGHVCLEPPHQSTVLPSTPYEGTSIPSPQPQAYPTNSSYEYPQNLAPPAPPDQNTAHLMTVIAQLESQIKMLHRENLQLRTHLSRWYELANLGEIPPPYGPPSSSRPDKPSPELPFKRYDSQDYTLNPSSPHNSSPDSHLPHSATLPSPPNLSPGLPPGLVPPPGLVVPEFRGSPNGGYEGTSLVHRYGSKQHPGITHTKSTYPAEGPFDGDVDDTEGDIEGEGEGEGEDGVGIGGMVVRNYQIAGTGLRENGKS